MATDFSSNPGNMLPAAQDNKIRLIGLGKHAPLKLCLDAVSEGDYHTITSFLQLFEDTVKNILEPNKSFDTYNLRDINFTWVANHNSNPLADSTLGIPNSMEDFLLWQNAGRYEFTNLQNLTIKKFVKTQGDEEAAEIDANYMVKVANEKKTLINNVGPMLSPKETSKLFISYFGKGYKGSLLNFFEPENLEKIRSLMKVILRVGFAMLPDTMIDQFRRGGFRNFNAISEYLLDAKKCVENEPDILKFRGMIKSIMSAQKFGIKIQSMVANARDIFSNYITKNYKF